MSFIVRLLVCMIVRSYVCMIVGRSATLLLGGSILNYCRSLLAYSLPPLCRILVLSPVSLPPCMGLMVRIVEVSLLTLRRLPRPVVKLQREVLLRDRP